ncbi:hypothetical protein [Rubrivirga sp.]|uniref:hypothetical protein n=1 Tax=Rubrivirga sp. TaxID=1885344 RepID=UPI003C7268FE
MLSPSLEVGNGTSTSRTLLPRATEDRPTSDRLAEHPPPRLSIKARRHPALEVAGSRRPRERDRGV